MYIFKKFKKLEENIAFLLKIMDPKVQSFGFKLNWHEIIRMRYTNYLQMQLDFNLSTDGD